MKSILIVDDDRAVRRTLERKLQREGYSVETAADGLEGAEKGLSKEVDLVLLDLRLPKLDGFEVLKRLKGARPALPVVVITAFDDMQTAIEAIRLGALDHLGKPLDLGELDEILQKVTEMVDLSRSPFTLADSEETPFHPHLIVGRSRAMKKVFKAIGAVADAPTTVLITGESGTGKELVAKAIHYNGRLKARPFVPVVCSALAPSVLESELFGHERGAFTGAHASKPGKFERAQGGSLFLDEIAETSPDVQVKLLRFLQEREFERVGGLKPIRVDVRVIAATHRSLADDVARGRFREDLFYRLRVVEIELPPLRDRREDIPLLVRYFLTRLREELGRTVDVVPDATIQGLMEYDWPGNVRELENTLRRAIVLSPGHVLLPEALELDGSAFSAPELPLRVQSLRELERQHIRNILEFTSWHKTRAARILQISRPTLNSRIAEYGLRPRKGSR